VQGLFDLTCRPCRGAGAGDAGEGRDAAGHPRRHRGHAARPGRAATACAPDAAAQALGARRVRAATRCVRRCASPCAPFPTCSVRRGLACAAGGRPALRALPLNGSRGRSPWLASTTGAACEPARAGCAAASLAAAAAGAGSGAGFPPASRVLGGAGARSADGAVQITELAAEADGAPAERAASSGAGARTPAPHPH